MGKFFTEKRKKEIIVYLILWLVFAIVFVMPISVAYVDSSAGGSINTNLFINEVFSDIVQIESRVRAFQNNYVGSTTTILRNYTIIFFIVAIILMLKKGKGAYRDIEHGSSDWSTGGEQYKVLSRKEGIILAEHNYLPVDKKGNVNVLIVGRIWCW